MKTPPLSDPVKIALFMTIREVLKPLIDKWGAEAEDAKSNTYPYRAGISHAMKDVQSIIDGAAARIEAMGASAEVFSMEVPKNIIVNVVNDTPYEIDVRRTLLGVELDVIVTAAKKGSRPA